MAGRKKKDINHVAIAISSFLRNIKKIRVHHIENKKRAEKKRESVDKSKMTGDHDGVLKTQPLRPCIGMKI